MKPGDHVYWKNDPDQRRWTVLRARDDSQFVYIVDNPKLYPKTDSHSVPRGTLSKVPFHVERAAAPRSAANCLRPAALHPERYLPPAPTKAAKAEPPKPPMKVTPGLDVAGLKQFAAERGAAAHHLEDIARIWAEPAPNKPMVVMRVHNYIKNAYKRGEISLEPVTQEN